MWETDEIRPRRPTPVEEAIERPADLRTDALGRRAALPARARPRAARRNRRGLAARRGADSVRIVDGRRPRRQSRRSRPTSRGGSAWSRGGWRRTSTSASSRRCSSSCRSPTRPPNSGARAGGAREPYRAVLRDVRAGYCDTRVARRALARATRRDGGGRLLAAGSPRSAGPLPPVACRDRAGLDRGGPADRRPAPVAAFGLTLVRLDVRQHASRHAAALDGDHARRAWRVVPEWGEAERQAFLDCARSRSASQSRARCRRRRRGARRASTRFRAAAQTSTRIARRLRRVDGAGAVRRPRGRVPAGAWPACRLRVVPLFEQVDDLEAAPPQTMQGAARDPGVSRPHRRTGRKS